MNFGHPVRLNLVDIEIKKLSKKQDLIDKDFREPSAAKYTYSQTKKLRGQVNLGEFNYSFRDRAPSRTGDQEISDGHVLFELAYLEKTGFTPEKGDLVTNVAGVKFDFNIKEVKPVAPLNGKFLLLMCYLENRNRSV